MQKSPLAIVMWIVLMNSFSVVIFSFLEKDLFLSNTPSEGRTKTSTVSAVCLFAQYSQILFHGQKSIINSPNNSAYKHHLLDLLICMLQ